MWMKIDEASFQLGILGFFICDEETRRRTLIEEEFERQENGDGVVFFFQFMECEMENIIWIILYS